MKKLIILMLLCGVVTACEKNSDGGGDTPVTDARVLSIKGTHDHWGDFTMDVKYQQDNLDSIIIRDAAGEKTGFLYTTVRGDTLTHRFVDIVPTITPERIQELIDEYGPEEAKKRITTSNQTYMFIQIVNRQGSVAVQTFETYRRRDRDGGDFDYRYIIDTRRQYAYEYDRSDRIAVTRMLSDDYDHEVSEGYYTRTIRKAEANYAAARLQNMDIFRSEGDQEIDENYVPEDAYEFTYDSDILSSVEGQLLKMNYTYEGGLPVGITADGQVTSYQYTAEGLVKRITYPGGNFFEVTYQTGVGNIGNLFPLFDKLFNKPVLQ